MSRGKLPNAESLIKDIQKHAETGSGCYNHLSLKSDLSFITFWKKNEMNFTPFLWLLLISAIILGGIVRYRGSQPMNRGVS